MISTMYRRAAAATAEAAQLWSGRAGEGQSVAEAHLDALSQARPPHREGHRRGRATVQQVHRRLLSWAEKMCALGNPYKSVA